MTSVLVTGCAGYIGSTLCQELLIRNYDVVGVDSLRFDNGHSIMGLLGSENFSFRQYDVRFPSAHFNDLVEHVDVIIPLAALVGAPLCDKSPHEATAVNFSAVNNMMAAVGRFQKVVFPNTNSGYGQTTGESFVTEEDPMNPISRYGITKRYAESAVRRHSNSAVFRLATVFGASQRMRMDLMVNDFTRKLFFLKQKRRPIPLSTGRPDSEFFKVFDPHFKRNFVHVRDVARAFIYAIENDLRGVYNLGLPTANMTKIELAHRICDELDLDRSTVVVGEGKDPDQRNYMVSNEKILKAGFVFENSLEKGIHEVRAICDAVGESATYEMGNV